MVTQSTGPKKPSRVVSRTESGAMVALLKDRTRPFTAIRNWVGPTAPMVSGGNVLVSSRVAAVKLGGVAGVYSFTGTGPSLEMPFGPMGSGDGLDLGPAGPFSRWVASPMVVLENGAEDEGAKALSIIWRVVTVMGPSIRTGFPRRWSLAVPEEGQTGGGKGAAACAKGRMERHNVVRARTHWQKKEAFRLSVAGSIPHPLPHLAETIGHR